MIKCTRALSITFNCTEAIVCKGGGVVDGLSLRPNFQKEGVDTISVFRGGCWESRGSLFSLKNTTFYSTNKLKSQIFNERKSL